MKEKTLFLGNGFSRAMFENTPSWVDLISSGAISIPNYPILYEIELNNSTQNEENFKKNLAKKLESVEIKASVASLFSVAHFGELLQLNGINNIITTNYENGILYILKNNCGYEHIDADNSENVYSIHRFFVLFNKTTNHTIRVWKIHGDVSNCKTMQLGLNQYGGYLSQIKEYVNGNYSYKQKKQTVKYDSIEDRLLDGDLDINSWIDLFFSTDIYIAGFGMSFSEIDIWWLLIKRLRLKKISSNIKNRLYYIFSKDIDEEMDKSIESALGSVDVEIRTIKRTYDFIKDTFDEIKSI